MTFSSFKLSRPLLKAVDKLGYVTPTPIQEQVIPLAMAGRDLIGCAETGSGKTAAFLLPIIERIVRGEKHQALILAPTREIALQTELCARALTTGYKFNTVCVIGGANMSEQVQGLAKGAHIIIATPGRLLDHLGRRPELLDGVGILVLDEADRLLDMGFLPEVREILDSLPLDRQSMLFSATLSEGIQVLAEETLLDPEEVQIGRRATTVATLDQSVYSVLSHAKLPLLLSLLKTEVEGCTIIFTRTKRGAERLAEVLKVHEYRVALLHGDRTQVQRNSAMADIHSGRKRILVATDLAARGLDIPSIGRVINYDVPEYPEDYVHRVGRTARAGREGQAYTFVAPQDEEALSRIEKLINLPLTRRTLTGFSDGREMLALTAPVAAAVKRRPLARVRSGRTFAPRGR